MPLSVNWQPCPNCGKPHAPSALQCSKCGRFFATGRLGRTGLEAVIVTCAVCGSPNYSHRERCWKCLAAIATLTPYIAQEAIQPPADTPEPPASTGDRTASTSTTIHSIRSAPSAPSLRPEVRLKMEDDLSSLTDTIKDGRGDPETYELRAACLIDLGRVDDAELDLAHVENAAHRDALLGDIASARGQFREAAEIYESLLADDPSRTGIALKLARLYVRQGSFNPDDISFVRSTIDAQIDRMAQSPDWVQVITFLHERYAAAGQWEQELSLLRAVAQRNPLRTNPRLGFWMADALIQTAETGEAARLVAELPLESGHPSAISAFLHVARALVRQGETHSARDLYLKVASAPKTARAQAASAVEMAAMLDRADQDQRFVPLERIGLGAVAEVWKAFDLYTSDLVGLKILHASLSEDPSVVEELRREYDLMTSSLNPRLARSIPGTYQDDRFAMELLDYSLADLLTRPEHAAGLPITRAVQIAQQVSEGLEYLHALGLVYQDLSPQNILFKNDDVKLCDLGGVKEGAKAGAAAAVAKVAYASPEQCALLMGEASSNVDRRSDIYNLGVILYQMATGRIPFDGPDQAVLHAHLYSMPVAPIIHQPTMSRDLNKIILRCMARDPGDRYSTAAELWGALGSAHLENIR